MNSVVKEKGTGWVEYYWPKPGSTDIVHKISYVQGCKSADGINMVVGSGLYMIDDALMKAWRSTDCRLAGSSSRRPGLAPMSKPARPSSRAPGAAPANQTETVMFDRFQAATLKTRLAIFAGLAVLLVLVLVGSNRLASHRIDQAYAAMEAANAQIDTANQAIDAANLLKEQVSDAMMHVMELRLTEKSYLQFHDAADQQRFDQSANAVAGQLTAIGRQDILGPFGDYRRQFNDYTSVHDAHAQLKVAMARPVDESIGHIMTIKQELEGKQAVLQLEGDDLGAVELELLNVVRDCQIFFLRLQSLQQKYLDTGDQTYIDQYRELASGDGLVSIDALVEFPVRSRTQTG